MSPVRRAGWGLLLGLLLSACGPQEPAASASGPLRSVRDAAEREVQVPVAPQRIVVLSELDLDMLLALDLRPVGATSARGSDRPPSYLGERASQIESVGNFAQPGLDRIVMLRPDLILAGSQPDREWLEQLQGIAPTLVSFKVGEPWQDSFRRVAAAIGRPMQAQQFIDRYRQRVADLSARPRQAGQTVSIVRLSPNGPLYMLGDAFAGRVLADLGFARPPAQQQPGAGHAPPLSREKLDDIDADWLFIGNFTPDPHGVTALRGEPAFATLRAARRGQVREVDASLWTVIGGPLAALAVLDDVERFILPDAGR